jgi:hypothetical protein
MENEMADYSHLNALELRLHNETIRHGADSHIVAMCRKEIKGERRFLGLAESAPAVEPSDDDLLRELSA